MHDHNHPHEHLHENADPAETLALLNYLLGHNRSHARELDELAHRVDNEQAHLLLHAAVDALEESNDKLEAALALLR
jgi:hypothetical protein